MKFVCDACNARYVIDDAKVRGKVLRVKCKKCGHLITVREPARPESADAVRKSAVRATAAFKGFNLQAERDKARAAREAAAADAATKAAEAKAAEKKAAVSKAAKKPAKPELDPADQWFYAQNGKTLGPYSEDELLERFLAGQIGDEVYVWQQGFDAWKPATQIPVFASSIEQAKQAPRPTSKRTMQVDVDDLFSVRPKPALNRIVKRQTDKHTEPKLATAVEVPRDEPQAAAAESPRRDSLSSLKSQLRSKRDQPKPDPSASLRKLRERMSGEYEATPEVPDDLLDDEIFDEGSGTPSGAHLVDDLEQEPHEAIATADIAHAETDATETPDATEDDVASDAPSAVDALAPTLAPKPSTAEDETSAQDAEAAHLEAAAPFDDEEGVLGESGLHDMDDEPTHVADDALPEADDALESDAAADLDDALADPIGAFEPPPEDLEKHPKVSIEIPGLDADHLHMDDAPSASLLLQVKEGRAASMRRAFILLGVLVIVGVAAVIINSGSPEETSAPPLPEVEQPVVETPRELTPEQQQRLAENTRVASRRASRVVIAGVEAGESDMVTHLSVEQVAALQQAQADQRARREARRHTERSNTQPSGVREYAGADPTLENPDVAQDPAEDVATPAGPTGPRVADNGMLMPGVGPAPGVDRPGTQQEGPSADHFRDGMSGFIATSIQRCNQRQITEEGALDQARITLSVTVMPSGRVSEVSVDRDLRQTAFARCLNSQRGRWLFDRFQGDPVTLERTYVVQ